MDKLKTLFNLFRVGGQVADPATWQNSGTAATVMTAFVIAAVHLLSLFGVTHGMDIQPEVADKIGGGLAFGYLFIVHIIASGHTGLLPAKPVRVDDPADDGAGSGNQR